MAVADGPRDSLEVRLPLHNQEGGDGDKEHVSMLLARMVHDELERCQKNNKEFPVSTLFFC